MTIGMCACGGIYCKYCGDPYRASPYMHETSAGTNSASITLTAPADHGISPAQLREKVEALEAKYQGVNESIDDLEKRLDAALRRIEQLERNEGAPVTCPACGVTSGTGQP